jgi:hypothetical protein
MRAKEDSMSIRIAALVAWTLATLAFSAPATAQTVDIDGITGGDTFASTGDPGDTGTTGTGETTGGSLLGGTGDTIASLSLGSGGTGPATGDGRRDRRQRHDRGIAERLRRSRHRG